MHQQIFSPLRLTLFLCVAVALIACDSGTPQATQVKGEPMQFERIPIQFIAALGDPDATSGNNAEQWGIWTVDPGPRGVRLYNFDRLEAAKGIAPAGWQFDNTDWWLEENGLIMEPPEFPLEPGFYLVTGDREVTTVLTVYAEDENGQRRWELADAATLYDVTHLGCRSARYTPAPGLTTCSPALAPQAAFRVAPGAEMPPVEGCAKQDYAVLFVIGVGVDNS
ncbi:MAG: hypothetical protein ACR2QG_06370 [Gammaproteobacteria bacterium]